MARKRRLPLKGYVISGVIILLAFVSISIIFRFLSSDYPTHSDVFFMGIEAGFLAFVLLTSLFLIVFFLYQLAMVLRKIAKTSLGS